MLAVQSYGMNSNVVPFKANETENKRPEKTHAGLKTGAIYTAVGSAMSLSSMGFLKKIVKSSEEAIASGEVTDKFTIALFKSLQNVTKSAGKKLWITIPLFSAVAVGCGAFVDHLINKKREALAEKVEAEGKDAVLKEDKRAKETPEVNVVYKSNQGKKAGAIMGAVLSPIFGIISATSGKSKIPVFATMITGALDGFILGAITDKCANKEIAKSADKQADSFDKKEVAEKA